MITNFFGPNTHFQIDGKWFKIHLTSFLHKMKMQPSNCSRYFTKIFDFKLLNKEIQFFKLHTKTACKNLPKYIVQ